MISYLTLIVGILVVIGSMWASLWLARRGDVVAQSQSSDAGEGLRHAAQMLGLHEVRESRLFQARILGAWGEINEFGVNCELWEQVQDPFYRVTIAYPRPLLRGIRISRDAEGGLLHKVLGAEEEKPASDEIVVKSSQDIDELRIFLQDDLRKPLERLAARVNKLQMGDEYLYLYVKSAPDSAFCESLLREALAVANKVFGRAMELGPSKKTKKASSYGQARTEMSRRVVVDVEGEERAEESKPAGRVTLSSVASSSSAIEGGEGSGEAPESSIWARRSSGANEQEVSEEEVSSDKADVNAEPKRALSSTLPGVGK